MTNLKQAKCPGCKAVLRFAPSKNAVFAVNCPSCNHLFEVHNEVAEPEPTPDAPGLKPSLVVATPVEAQPVDAPFSEVAITAQPVVEIDEADEDPFQSIPKPILPNARPSYPATETRSASRKTARPRSQQGASGGQVNRSHHAMRSESHTKASRPWWLLAVVPACLLCIVGAVVGFLLLNPSRSGSEKVAVDANRTVDEFLSLTGSITSTKDRRWAAERIEELNVSLDKLVFDASQLPDENSEQLSASTKQLDEHSTQWRELERRCEELTTGHPSHDLLVIAIEQSSAKLSATKAIIRSLLIRDAKPTDRTAELVNRGLQLEERFVRRLGLVRSNSDIEAALGDLQAIADELNTFAELQASEGQKIGPVPRDLVAIDSDLGTIKDYFADRTERVLKPDPDFKRTIKDFDFVQDRFDQALYKFELQILANNSRQRVAGLGADSNGAPRRNQVASASASMLKSGTIANRPAPPASSTTNSDPYSDAASDTGVRNSQTYSQSAPPRDLDSDTNSVARSEIEARSGGQGNLGGQRPQGRSTDSTSGSSLGAGSPFGSPGSSPKEPPMTGPNAITIRVFGNINVESVRSQLNRSLGSSRSMVDEAGDHVILCFRYSGKLASMANKVKFGDIEISDNQSRTLFVRSRESE